MRDVHLAAAAIQRGTRAEIESLGFKEDFFEDCRNCAPTQYHATFRGRPEEICDRWWYLVCGTLRADSEFNGLLEQERSIREVSVAKATVGAPAAVPPIPIQPCPPDVHKASDVHMRIKVDPDAATTLEWLDLLSVASFSKQSSGQTWRIYTVTCDFLSVAEQFVDAVLRTAPRTDRVQFTIKLEKTERVLRHPRTAVTLPITYSHQLARWLAVVS